MALLAAAFVPVPPLLVPEVAGGSAAADECLRSACRAAVASLGDRPVVVVGAAPESRAYRGGLDFRSFGVRFPEARPTVALPAALGIGCWLLDGQAVGYEGVRTDEPTAACLARGQRLVADRDVALLVCADGTARRSEQAPGYLDDRAAGFDAVVQNALSRGDPRVLAELELSLAADLLCAGRAAWQVLAGAGQDRSWQGEVLYAAAPYGVSYAVATWAPG